MIASILFISLLTFKNLPLYRPNRMIKLLTLYRTQSSIVGCLAFCFYKELLTLLFVMKESLAAARLASLSLSLEIERVLARCRKLV